MSFGLEHPELQCCSSFANSRQIVLTDIAADSAIPSIEVLAYPFSRKRLPRSRHNGCALSFYQGSLVIVIGPCRAHALPPAFGFCLAALVNQSSALVGKGLKHRSTAAQT